MAKTVLVEYLEDAYEVSFFERGEHFRLRVNPSLACKAYVSLSLRAREIYGLYARLGKSPLFPRSV